MLRLRTHFLALAVFFLAALATVVLFTPRIGHVENMSCSGQGNLHRTSSSTTVQDFNHRLSDSPPFNKTLAYQGVQYAIGQITPNTDFDFFETSGVMPDPPGVDQWNRFSLGSSGPAGMTIYNNDITPLSPTPCSDFTNGEIIRAKYYYSVNHSWVSANDYKCVAIHEFLHGLGLAHNNDVGSVMRQTGTFFHSDRCHGASPTLTLSAADIADVNALY